MRKPDPAAWRRLPERLGIEHPIVQAPMGGGPTTPALVAAVSNAGGLGSIAGGYLDPERLREEIAEVRRATDRPFAVNLFAGGATDGAEDPSAMLALLARWHERLGIPPPAMPAPSADRFAEQLEVVLEAGVPVFSFTFGIPDAAALGALRRRGAFLMGTATTVAEARLLEERGVDAVVAQGSEAGAHRGTFLGPFEAALVGTVALVPQVADAVSVPVVASGGIMDGRGLAAALALGASGVQMGTAFLTTREAGTAEAHRRRLLGAREHETSLTRAFSGRPARGIRNAFMDEVERSGVPVPPYPVQNGLTRPLRAAAARRGEPEALSLWAGQGVGLAREESAAGLVARLVEEARAVRDALSSQLPSDSGEGAGPV